MNKYPETLPHPDNRHLEAADGWLGLGNWREATAELDTIRAEFHTHPHVLEMRYKIHGAAREWDKAVEIGLLAREKFPDQPWGHFYAAFALHELKRTREAYDTLRPVIDKFPAEQIMRYNLACYACQLGRLEEAMDWYQQTIRIPGKNDIRKLALDDKDLEPLWPRIKTISV